MWYPNWILKMCKHGPAVASYYHLDQIHTSDHWFHCPASTPPWALLICHFSPGSLCSRRGWASFLEEYFSQLLPQGFCLNWSTEEQQMPTFHFLFISERLLDSTSRSIPLGICPALTPSILQSTVVPGSLQCFPIILEKFVFHLYVYLVHWVINQC